MNTSADCHDFSNRPYPEGIPKYNYPSTMKVMKLCQNGSMRWKSYYWVYLTAALKEKYVGLEDNGNGIWKAYYRDVFLDFSDERHLRGKESSTKLETNLV